MGEGDSEYKQKKRQRSRMEEVPHSYLLRMIAKEIWEVKRILGNGSVSESYRMCERRECMRRKLGCLSLAGFVVFLTLGAIPVDAGIRPSFSVDHCSWNAMHIVLVPTTPKDGVFSVVESWKGNLKPGDSLEVPELKPNKDSVPISSFPKPQGLGSEDTQGISEQIPRQPVGSRMILFLKKKEEGNVASPSAGNTMGTQWESASGVGGMKVSAVWIDGAKSYCFIQWMNPGPSALSECLSFQAMSSDVAVFTARIQRILQVQKHLAETMAMKNHPEARADRLGRIALGDVWEAQREALDALGKSGTVALPEILQVMDEPPVPYDGEVTIRAFVEAAGKDSGKLLHARLQQHLIYWKAVGPTLTPNWLDQLIEPGASLFVKFNETVLLIRELDRKHYAPATQTVAELHDFWVSQPLLCDHKWGERDLRNGGTALEMIRAESFGLAKQCDDFVKHVAAKKTNQ